MLEAYRAHAAERHLQGIPPKALDPEWTAGLVELLKNPPAGEEDFKTRKETECTFNTGR